MTPSLELFWMKLGFYGIVRQYSLHGKGHYMYTIFPLTYSLCTCRFPCLTLCCHILELIIFLMEHDLFSQLLITQLNTWRKIGCLNEFASHTSRLGLMVSKF
jgi:hypothetical protein